MIINIINVNRMTVVEAECYTPIPRDRYSPKTSEASPEWMQTEARDVHITRPAAAVQYRKDVAKYFQHAREPLFLPFSHHKGL